MFFITIHINFKKRRTIFKVKLHELKSELESETNDPFNFCIKDSKFKNDISLFPFVKSLLKFIPSEFFFVFEA